MSKFYLGDANTEIELDSQTDLSSASDYEIRVLKPSGAVLSLVSTIVSLTKLKATITELDEIGTWKAQIWANVGTWSGLGETYKFKVYDPYK